MERHGSTAAGKAKNSKLAAKEFLHSIKPYWFPIGFSVVLAIGSAVLNLFIPKLLGDMTNLAVNSYPEIDWPAISSKAITVVVLFVLSAALNYAQAFVLAVVSANYTKDLREKIIQKIAKLPISYFDKHQYGDTLSRMTNDVDVLTTSLSQEIADISLSLTIIIGILIMMFTISVPLTLVSIIVVPFSVLVVGKITNFAQKYFREQQNTLGVLNSKIEEDYAGLTIIKANSYEKTATASFDATNQKLAKAAVKAQVFSSLSFPVTHVFTNLGYIAICILGGAMVIDPEFMIGPFVVGGISIGSLQAFIQYVSRFNRPITEIASTTATIQSLLAASERIFEFLGEAEESPDPEPALTIDGVRGEVVFDKVDFSYDGKTPVIRDFSVKVKPGSNVAIVGPTGAGKTTIINLLMRFYEPTSGKILVDGVPISEMKRADVRGMFGMVLQDTWLFNGTVEDNLRYGKRDATLADVKAVAKFCNIEHIVEALPKNYKTEISEDSDNISAGEKQLLTIARAMVANPPMMILDEATSNVDTRTEQLIQDSLEKLTNNRTSWVIAHRLSTIRNSDLILVMRDGRIVESGNHEELLGAGGFYAELYNSQFAEN